ncbi:hypothetical protein F5X99DRAFT_371515 [Biscogniauxia marginata]|nr:hypothetical protein F5X99DRAFT_371515 [Biscogniauxia marginata]
MFDMLVFLLHVIHTPAFIFQLTCWLSVQVTYHRDWYVTTPLAPPWDARLAIIECIIGPVWWTLLSVM